MIVAAAVLLTTIGFGAVAAANETPTQAGEKVGIEGQILRVAGTGTGCVVLGDRIANRRA